MTIRNDVDMIMLASTTKISRLASLHKTYTANTYSVVSQRRLIDSQNDEHHFTSCRLLL